MKISTNVYRIIRFIIIVIAVASIVHAYDYKSIPFLIIGIIAIILGFVLKKVAIQV